MKKLILNNLTVIVLFFFFDMIVLYVDKYATESASEIITILWIVSLLVTLIWVNRKSFNETASLILKYVFRVILIGLVFIISWAIAFIYSKYY